MASLMGPDDKPLELILKIQVPHMGIVKTLRTSTGYKVAQLARSVIEKLETAEKQDFSHFGLYWYNETGPLWLADNSFLRAYGFKNGDTLQFKQKPSLPAKKPLALSSNIPNPNPNPASRLKTASVPAPISALPSVPSHAVQKDSTKPSAKDALLKAFQVDTKSFQSSTSPPPPSTALHSPPSLASPPSLPSPGSFTPPTPSPLQIPSVETMQKSMSTPSPTHRSHSVTAPPKPYNNLTLTVSNEETKTGNPPTILEESSDDDEVKLSVSPRKHSPVPHHRSPSPEDSPPTLLIPPHLRSELPRIPSQPPTGRRPSESSIHHPPSLLLDAQPRMARAQTNAHDLRPDSKLFDMRPPPPPETPKHLETRPLQTVKSHDKPHAQSCNCAHREDFDRERINSQRLKQRIDLTECILTDTLQAIEEGESDTKAIKMYINAALASLRKEDVRTFGGTMHTK